MATVPLITLLEFKRYLSIRDSITDYDDQIAEITAQSTKQLEQFTNQKFEKSARIEYFPARDNNKPVLDLIGMNRDGYYSQVTHQVLLLKSKPVNQGASFVLKYEPNRKWDDVAAADSESYYVDAEAGKVVILFATSKTPRGFQVSYTGGYASAGSPTTLSASAPEDLKLACLAQSYFLFDKLNTQSFGVMSAKGEDGKMYRKQDGILCQEALKLAQPYRRIGLSG